MVSTLANIIDYSAQRFSQKEAFKYLNTAITFKEARYKVNQLVHVLLENGLQKGDCIGIYMERNLESFISVHAILKAGGVFVPLDPTAPTERTLFLLKDCNIKLLLSSPLQYKKLIRLIDKKCSVDLIVGVKKKLPIKQIAWDVIFDTNIEDVNIDVEIDPSDLAYIMYTSGSTGNPKGIMHTHFSGLNYAKQSVDLYQVTDQDRVANFAPLHFDIATFGYFSSPLAGACTIMISDAHTQFPLSLSQLIEAEKISIWYSVPLALIQLLEKGNIAERDFSALRWIKFGGEVFIDKYLKKLVDYLPNVQFCNVYGPAEVNQCTYYHVNTSNIKDPLPIGSVWSNTTFKILTSNNIEVAVGEIGELVVQTITMMKGYWNNEELTNNSLYIDKDQNVFYKTGDLAYQNQDKELVFAGRKDTIVKIRGYRVDLGEIEAILTKHQNIEEAAAIITGKENEKRILAYITLSKEMNKKAIEQLCKQFLPTYAVPSEIRILKSLPRTTSGKISRKQIKKMIF